MSRSPLEPPHISHYHRRPTPSNNYHAPPPHSTSLSSYELPQVPLHRQRATIPTNTLSPMIPHAPPLHRKPHLLSYPPPPPPVTSTTSSQYGGYNQYGYPHRMNNSFQQQHMAGKDNKNPKSLLAGGRRLPFVKKALGVKWTKDEVRIFSKKLNCSNDFIG